MERQHLVTLPAGWKPANEKLFPDWTPDYAYIKRCLFSSICYWFTAGLVVYMCAQFPDLDTSKSRLKFN